MALIKCSECGRDITNTNKTCIHCGSPVKTEKYTKKKIQTIIIICVIVFISVPLLNVFKSVSLVPHTIQNVELIQLLEYADPLEIKAKLGNNYEHNTYTTDFSHSSADEYEDITIDGKAYSQVEISYDSRDEFQRIYLRTDAIWSKTDYETLINDLVEQYGNDYEYEEDEYNGRPIYDYKWNMGFPREISCSIHADDDNENKYWVRLNSFHN